MEAGMTPPERESRSTLREISGLWWLWLLFGIAWVIVGLVILQFDQASITTVGVIVGLMFLATGVQQFAVSSFLERDTWVYWLFGGLFLVAGVIALISPENTFAALADILGFLFLIVGVF